MLLSYICIDIRPKKHFDGKFFRYLIIYHSPAAFRINIWLLNIQHCRTTTDKYYLRTSASLSRLLICSFKGCLTVCIRDGLFPRGSSWVAANMHNLHWNLCYCWLETCLGFAHGRPQRDRIITRIKLIIDIFPYKDVGQWEKYLDYGLRLARSISEFRCRGVRGIHMRNAAVSSLLVFHCS